MGKRVAQMLLTMVVFAGGHQAVAAGSWKSNFPVKSVITLNNGGFILLLEASDPACGSSGNQFYVQTGLNGQTTEGVKVALAVALTAFSTGRTVNAYVDTAINGCPVQYLQINE
jgi:hypothetical protein